MEFRVLGPLEVAGVDGVVRIQAAKPRTLLAVLLLHANEVVSVSRLVTELWAEHPPATARKLVPLYVSQLRRILGPDVIVTRAPGYVIELGTHDLDAARFRRLVCLLNDVLGVVRRNDARSNGPHPRPRRRRERGERHGIDRARRSDTSVLGRRHTP